MNNFITTFKQNFNRFKRWVLSSYLGKTRNRMRGAVVGLLVMAMGLGVRLMYLQGFDNGLAQTAQERRMSKSIIPASRGQILDQSGKILATNVTRYDITVTPKNVAPVERTTSGHQEVVTVDKTVADVANILGMSQPAVKKAFEGDTTKPMDQRQFAYVKKDVSPDDKAKIDNLNIPWLGADETTKRVYPSGSVAGNILGFTNDAGPLAGIEQSENEELQGKDGERIIERGADGIRIATAPTRETPPVNGNNVKLTINSDVQAFAQQAADSAKTSNKADWAMITVLNAKTGQVVAMAADGTVDPNNPQKTDEDHRYNRNVSEVYEPGSTAKMMFAAASMQEGIVEPTTKFEIPYTIQMGSQVFKDSHEHSLQHVTLAGILAQSSNTGTLMMGQKLTVQQRYNYLEKFGFGQLTGIELPGESAGIVNPIDQWDERTQYSVMFGQGFAVTNLQMTSAYATLANNGVRMTPRIVESVIDQNGVEHKTEQPAGVQVVSKETAKKSQELMESVVTDGGGRFSRIANYRVGGKTGTAEVASKDGKGFDGSTASFIGVAPLDNPEFVVNVTIQRPRTDTIWGEYIAAPVVKEVMEETLRAYNVPPSTPQTVRLPVTYDGDELE
ncbi:MAG: penicillin-binding protein 2 [Micrococcaceae bacterium]